MAELTMTSQQANGGHCTSGGTIASGSAVCQCGTWAAAAFPDPESRKASRKDHLDQVVAMRRSGQHVGDTGSSLAGGAS